MSVSYKNKKQYRKHEKKTNKQNSKLTNKIRKHIKKMKGGNNINRLNFINIFKNGSFFFNPKIEIILQLIYDNNQHLIENYLSSGTTKQVFSASNNKVFKVVIFPHDELGRAILEPLYMLSSQYCNTPFDITVYCNTSNCKIDNVTIINCVDLVDSGIITWYEERAVKTDILTFVGEEKSAAIEFVKKTIPELEKDLFTDLGFVNVGLFADEPKYRWIDVQPSIEKLRYTCL